MNCRDVREVADSFLSDELPAATNDEVVRHLDTCPACQSDIDARRAIRRAVHTAFDHARDLQPTPEFLNRIHGQLRNAALRDRRPWRLSGPWMALAASLALAAALTAAVRSTRSTPADALALDAIGSHRNCALKFRLVRMPMPLEEAAQRFDTAFRLLLTTPPDDMATPGGPAHVIDRHSCGYDGRRFGHVILEYQGHVVSLLMTANATPVGADVAGAVPHVIGRPGSGLSVVSVDGNRHAVVLVSDLGGAELTRLSAALSVPLTQRLTAGVAPEKTDMVAALFPPQAR